MGKQRTNRAGETGAGQKDGGDFPGAIAGTAECESGGRLRVVHGTERNEGADGNLRGWKAPSAADSERQRREWGAAIPDAAADESQLEISGNLVPASFERKRRALFFGEERRRGRIRSTESVEVLSATAFNFGRMR